MPDRISLISVLRAELAFLEQGGYRRGPRYPWRPNFVFEDSPTCINFKETEQRLPCGQCPLIAFVPELRRNHRFPCRHIHLTDRGETVNSFYEWGTEEELEAALHAWLTKTIAELEAQDQARSQTAA
ncbi:MAG TPA: hypothetical protein VEJ47_19005 [Candidatus Eremiobacteraceae bacterium]|nr:hypothetical protein [Candidatus Eremiobacteraceae bacterium]